MKKYSFFLLGLVVASLLNIEQSKNILAKFLEATSLSDTTSQVATTENTEKISDLIICSQNLANYGSFEDVIKRVRYMKPSALLEKEKALVKRFALARCDVVAVQEVLSSTKANAIKNLDRLAKLLSHTTKRKFQAYLGDSNDSQISSGFIVATDSVSVEGTHSFFRTELPKLSKGQKQRYFSRGPYMLTAKIKQKNGEEKGFKIINFHFKSRSSKGGYDPAGYSFETVRMEMAEALRQIAIKEAQDSNDLIVLLGDRNDHYDTAAAKILTGELSLDNFKYGQSCSIKKSGVPYCKNDVSTKSTFVSMFVNDPQMKEVEGTLKYKKNFYWLDEILVSKNALRYVQKGAISGDYDSGVVATPKNASDHSLLWVRFNFN